MQEFDEKCGSKSQPQHQQTSRHPEGKHVKTVLKAEKTEIPRPSLLYPRKKKFKGFSSWPQDKSLESHARIR